MDPTLAQIFGSLVGTGGLSVVLVQLVALRRETKRSPAPVGEAAARADIALQLETERTARAAAEHERDTANERAARAGRQRDAADRRAEAADRRANTERRAAEAWETHATAVRETCLAHGTPLQLLPARPAPHH